MKRRIGWRRLPKQTSRLAKGSQLARKRALRPVVGLLAVGLVAVLAVLAFVSDETAVSLENMDLEHNAAANDAANDALGTNAGMGLAIDSAFASHSGGNAAANDAPVEDGLGLETDSAFAGRSGGNAADNDADVDDSGEEADDFFGGSSSTKSARRDSAGQPRNYLAGLDYKAPNYLAGHGW